MIKTYLLFLLLLWTSALSALNLGTELNLSGSYRRDNIHRRNTFEELPPAVSSVDTINTKDLNIWQFGLDIRLMMPPADSHLDATFLNNFYVSGFAYWGWGHPNGGLHERSVGFTPPEVVVGRARLTNVRTHDYQIGLGYLFECGCFGLGLSSGYTWNRQRIRTTHGQIAIEPGPFAKAAIYGPGYRTTTKWQSPFVGAELFCSWCQWLFSLGYEYHFVHFHLSHKIPDNAEARAQGIADRCRSSDGSGNVAFLKGMYRFCAGWDLQITLRYQNWRASGPLRPMYGSFVDNGFPEGTRARTMVRWTAYSAALEVGYSF